MLLSFTFCSAVLTSVIFWITARYKKKAGIRLPPGPEGEFILGNARQIPSSHPWLYYTDLAKKYGAQRFPHSNINPWGAEPILLKGDVMHLSIFGKPVVVLSSYKAMEGTILKKSAIFSGRPHLVMSGDLYVAV